MTTSLEEAARTVIDLTGHPPVYLSVCRDLDVRPHAGGMQRVFAAVGRAISAQFVSVPRFLAGLGYTMHLAAREQQAHANVSRMLGLPYDTHPAVLEAKQAGQRAYDHCRMMQQLSPADHHGDSKPWRGLRFWRVLHEGKRRAPEPDYPDAYEMGLEQWGDRGYP